MKQLLLVAVAFSIFVGYEAFAQAGSDINHGCLDCHDMTQFNDPNNPNMLKDTNIVALCQSCHEDSVTHGKFGTQYATCIGCHNHHDIKLLEYEDTCLSCHDDLERKGKHKVGSKCFKCHKHLKGFSKIKK